MSASLVFDSRSTGDTARLARALAAILQPGDVVALEGELGAGKTFLIRALAACWGIAEEEVTSPTFTLVRDHRGALPLRHMDAYRLAREDDFWELGPDEIFSPDVVTCVEWASRIARFLPNDALHVRLSLTTHPDSRRIEIAGPEPRIDALRAALEGVER